MPPLFSRGDVVVYREEAKNSYGHVVHWSARSARPMRVVDVRARDYDDPWYQRFTDESLREAEPHVYVCEGGIKVLETEVVPYGERKNEIIAALEKEIAWLRSL